jgi:hypothetical protein
VYNVCGDRAVPVKDIQVQLGAAWEGTQGMDHAAVVTHLDGLEISRECKERIRALHEEGN